MSAYIKLSTLEYPRYIGDIEIDPVGMSDYAPVQQVEPPAIDFNRQRFDMAQPTQQNGIWLMNWVVTQIPDAEEALKVRNARNAKLAQCDWTQVADAPVNQAVWATYRQALRDITTQAGFPWAIEWPTQPE